MPDEAPAPLHVPDHELVRRIGIGSYGEVWLARNVVGTWRAVKVVRRARFDSDRPYEREFNGIQKFEPISRSHSSQVDILHLGRNDSAGYFYYVMELADDATGAAAGAPESAGEHVASAAIRDPASYRPHTLKNDAEQHRRFPVAECVGIGLALTEALQHLHGNGLVHRDVKPSNIVFIGGRPKLADIGLVTDADATRTFVGTEGFLPLEGGGTVEADLYALGKVLYEISTGKDRRDFPQAPSDLDALEDRRQFLELSEVIERACDPDPRRRYGSAREMHDDLALIQRGASVRQQNVRKARMAAARRYGGTVAIVSAVFVLGILAASWMHLRRARASESMPLPTPERTTRSPEALSEYRLGRFWLAKRIGPAFSNALAHFDRAIGIDPMFPHAHAARAECLNLLASYNLAPVSEVFPLARDAALAALRLNTNIVEAHLALALYQRSYEWNWAGAEESFRRALALNPRSAAAHQWYSSLLSALGRIDEAVAHAKRAVELDPSSLAVNANLGARLYLARRYQESIAQYRKVIEMDSSFAVAFLELSRVYGQNELLYESAGMRLSGLLRTGEQRDVYARLGQFMQENGTVKFWLRYAEHLESADPPRPGQLAEAWLRGGDTNRALRALAAAVGARDPEAIYLNVDPLYDGLRQQPEFIQLCDRLGFNVSRGSEPLLRALERKLTDAERGAGITVDEKGGGFRPLFDGRALREWRSPATNWVVQDGVIYRAASGGPLRYEAEMVPDNFELRFEWKTLPGGDGGVNYRPGTVEYQVIDPTNAIVQAHADRRPGSLVACFPAGGIVSRTVGQWNEGRIICRGTEIEHWLNGRRVLRFNYADRRFAPQLAQLDALELKQFGRSTGNVRARGGYLQLLDQGTEVWFRHLRWRTLD
jgi:serine/threonine protein kinase/Tfp pilus assembly protein PilF